MLTQARKVGTGATTSRPYQVELRNPGCHLYSGEIIEFTTEFIELRFKQSRKQKFDIKVVSLRDPHLLAIFGDPKGGPGAILMLEDNIPYDPNHPLSGYLQAGPNGLVMLYRTNDTPVLINPAYMSIVNEDASTANFPHAKVGPKLVKLQPKTMARPPAGSPAAVAASTDWS